MADERDWGKVLGVGGGIIAIVVGGYLMIRKPPPPVSGKIISQTWL